MEEDQKKSKGKFLSFAVDEEMSARIKAEAAADGLSASSWVRLLIIKSLREKDREAARDKKSADGSP